MCSLEDLESFDVCQKLLTRDKNGKIALDGKKVLSKYPYCVWLGNLDEEKKANLEDEELRCAQELFEAFRAEEVEYPVRMTRY